MEGGMESKGEIQVDHFIFLKVFSTLDHHLSFPSMSLNTLAKFRNTKIFLNTKQSFYLDHSSTHTVYLVCHTKSLFTKPSSLSKAKLFSIVYAINKN